MRGPITHELKCHTPHFFAVVAGVKTFELRKLDRDYRENDFLLLREYDPATETYTGLDCKCNVLMMMSNVPQFGLMDGYCVMSISLLRHDANIPAPSDEAPCGRPESPESLSVQADQGIASNQNGAGDESGEKS